MDDAMNRIARKWLQRPWFAALLLITLVARGLMPTGFMPGPGGVMLCPGYAPVLSAADNRAGMDEMAGMPMDGMDMAHMDSAGQGHHGRQSPLHEGMCACPYAGAAAGVGLVNAPFAMLASQLVSTALFFPPEKLIPRGTIVPTRLPRGPPQNA